MARIPPRWATLLVFRAQLPGARNIRRFTRCEGISPAGQDERGTRIRSRESYSLCTRWSDSDAGVRRTQAHDLGRAGCFAGPGRNQPERFQSFVQHLSQRTPNVLSSASRKRTLRAHLVRSKWKAWRASRYGVLLRSGAVPEWEPRHSADNKQRRPKYR